MAAVQTPPDLERRPDARTLRPLTGLIQVKVTAGGKTFALH